MANKKKVICEGRLLLFKSRYKKDKYIFNTLHLSCCRKYNNTRAYTFPKNLEATLNSSHQTGDMKQAPYSGPTNIRCHMKCVKYSKKKKLDSTCYTCSVMEQYIY